jgi:hypothetical protein
MNQDYEFKMSKDGVFRVRSMARSKGINSAKAFRSMAGALAVMLAPHFAVSGEPLTETMTLGVSDQTRAALEQLCQHVGVPYECAGELVACCDYTGYADNWDTYPANSTRRAQV